VRERLRGFEINLTSSGIGGTDELVPVRGADRSGLVRRHDGGLQFRTGLLNSWSLFPGNGISRLETAALNDLGSLLETVAETEWPPEKPVAGRIRTGNQTVIAQHELVPAATTVGVLVHTPGCSLECTDRRPRAYKLPSIALHTRVNGWAGAAA
jgi:hypothetical protein